MGANYSEHVGTFSEAFPAAHLVPCGYNGNAKATGPGWKNPADHSAMRRHAETGWVGLIPASIGLTVVDVDEGSPLALAFKLCPEYLTNSGTPGNGHLWFKDDQSGGNWKWKLKAKDGSAFSGEIRSGSGYVVLWEPEILAGAVTFPGVGPSRPFREVEPWLRPMTAPEQPTLPATVPARSGRLEIERAISIIADIAPDSYDTWITVGQCLEGSARKGEFANDSAFSLWRNWSAQSAKFPGERAMSAKWDSFKGGKPRTLGSLVGVRA